MYFVSVWQLEFKLKQNRCSKDASTRRYAVMTHDRSVIISDACDLYLNLGVRQTLGPVCKSKFLLSVSCTVYGLLPCQTMDFF